MGTSKSTRIKITTNPRIGQQGEPVVELTKFGWTIMRARKETDVIGTVFTKSTSVAVDRLCSLNVLGLGKRDDQCEVFEEFNLTDLDDWLPTSAGR